MPCVAADIAKEICICVSAKSVECRQVRQAQAAADTAVDEAIDSASVGG